MTDAKFAQVVTDAYNTYATDTGDVEKARERLARVVGWAVMKRNERKVQTKRVNKQVWGKSAGDEDTLWDKVG